LASNDPRPVTPSLLIANRSAVTTQKVGSS
jgi:hypothetical protein